MEAKECKFKQQRLRMKTIEEIISSERSYLKHLDIILTYFIDPVQQRKLASVKETQMLFGPIESVISVNKELLQRCEQNHDDIGQIFLELAPFLKVYCLYTNGYEEANNLLKRVVEQKDSELAQFLQRQESRPEVGMKLNALLITPIQRIPRYKLLLEELLQHIPCESNDYKILQDAIRKVTSIAESINDCLKEQENIQHMLRIQRKLTKSRPRIVVPGRKLIKEGVLNKVSRKGDSSRRRIFFLFNDMLMYCKPRGPTLDCCFLAPLSRCRVESLFDAGDGNKEGVLFKITCGGDELFVYTSNVEEGDSWVENLNSAIDSLTGLRQTLRKESSKFRRPLRRSGLRKQQNPLSISQLHQQRHLQTHVKDKSDVARKAKSVVARKAKSVVEKRAMSVVEKRAKSFIENNAKQPNLEEMKAKRICLSLRVSRKNVSCNRRLNCFKCF